MKKEWKGNVSYEDSLPVDNPRLSLLGGTFSAFISAGPQKIDKNMSSNRLFIVHWYCVLLMVGTV